MKRSHWIVVPALALLLAPVMGFSQEAAAEATETEAAVATAETAEAADTAAAAKDTKIMMLSKEDAQKSLVGKWKLDTKKMKEAMLAQVKEESGDDAEAAMALAMIEAMMAQMEMSFEFKGDGTILTTQSMGEEAQTETNKWTISGVEKGLITVVVDEEPAIAVFFSKDIMEIRPTEEDAGEMPPGMSALRFNRIKK